MPRAAALTVILALAACEKAAKSPPSAAGGVFALRGEERQIQDSDRQLAGVRIAWIAEYAHGDRRAALVWPMMKQGKVIDDDTVAFDFQQSGGGWTLVPDEKFELDPSWQAIRPPAYALADLGPKIADAEQRYMAALKSHDDAGAIAAFDDWAPAFATESFQHGNPAADMMQMLAPVESITVHDLDAATGTATLTGTAKGQTQDLQVLLEADGAGYRIRGFKMPGL
jgi:hypothetical protein